MMLNIEKFALDIQNIYKLKYTYRYSDHEFSWGKDSTAAHSWCMMILADYFLDYLEIVSPWKYNLDKLKIYEYIMYHDLIEAETWDIDNAPSHVKEHEQKKLSEGEALEIFSKKIPTYIWEKLQNTFRSYECRDSLESKFVKIIDVFESQFQCFHLGEMRTDWDEKHFKFRCFRPEFKSFPELEKIMCDSWKVFKKRWYFDV